MEREKPRNICAEVKDKGEIKDLTSLKVNAGKSISLKDRKAAISYKRESQTDVTTKKKKKKV